MAERLYSISFSQLMLANPIVTLKLSTKKSKGKQKRSNIV